MKFMKGCFALILLAAMLAVFWGIIAAGIGFAWDLVTG